MDFLVEVAILAGAVGLLDVEVHEVVVGPALLQQFVFGVQGPVDRFGVHAHGTRHAAVHGISGDTQRPEPVHILHLRQFGIAAEAADQDHVGRTLAG